MFLFFFLTRCYDEPDRSASSSITITHHQNLLRTPRREKIQPGATPTRWQHNHFLPKRRKFKHQLTKTTTTTFKTFNNILPIVLQNIPRNAHQWAAMSVRLERIARWRHHHHHHRHHRPTRKSNPLMLASLFLHQQLLHLVVEEEAVVVLRMWKVSRVHFLPSRPTGSVSSRIRPFR